MRIVRAAGPTTHAPLLAAVAVTAAAVLLGGCGGGTKTVSVANAPTPPTSASTTSSSTGAGSSTTTTAAGTSTTAPGAGTGGTGPTRTAGAPAFVPPPASGGEAAAAAALEVRAHGYTPNDVSQYHPNQTLAVLVGTHSRSGDPYGQQAFFFVDGRYIGTDAAAPSATVHVLSQSDTQVTLGYPLYRAHDALCCPGGGEARVTFQLNNSHLEPLQAIPPVNSATGLSRQ
jgi:hypothetical protein